MKYIGQLTIILVITFLGEALNGFLPLPIPGSIYGFIIMLLFLHLKIIKLEMVKDVGHFLLDIMPIMFIPAAVGLIAIWSDVSQNIVQVLLIVVSTTIIVMVATGKVTDLVLRKGGNNGKRDN